MRVYWRTDGDVLLWATNFQFMNNNGSSWLKIESTQLTGPSAIGLSGPGSDSHNLNLLPGDEEVY